jgi:hypothetical protein
MEIDYYFSSDFQRNDLMVSVNSIAAATDIFCTNVISCDSAKRGVKRMERDG